MATYLNWTPAEMKAAFASGHRCSKPTEIVDGKATGVVRVSLGGMSTASDIRALISFLRASYVDTTTQKTTTSLAKQPLSLQRASFIKIQIPEEREMDAVVGATAPVIGTPTYRPPPVVRNRLRKSFDFSVGPSPGSSVTSISSAGLPRSQSSNLIGLRPKPNISRRRSLLSGSTSKPVVGKWDNFWKEETAALVAAGAVESEVKPITSSADTKKKEKERSGFRKVARALTLSRRHD
ncbi:PLP-dependent transferase, partial [Aureobasidium melanogenum]